MDINRDNYESWFLDFLDGRLDAGQEKILMSFLEFNHDLREELNGMEAIQLQPENVSYGFKSTLRKPQLLAERETIISNFEDYCIASLEQELSPEEEKILQDLIKSDPEKKKAFLLYHSTRLQADEEIIYTDKHRIRKRYIQLPVFRTMISSAAAVAVLILALSIFLRSPDKRVEITQSSQVQIMEQNNTSPNSMVAEQDTEVTELVAETLPVETEISKSAGKSEILMAPLRDINPSAQILQAYREPVILSMIHPIQAESIELPAYRSAKLIAGVYSRPEVGETSPTVLTELKESAWRLAEAGLTSYNSIAEESIVLERQIDQGGNPRRFKFETSLFGISAPLRKPDPPR